MKLFPVFVLCVFCVFACFIPATTFSQDLFEEVVIDGSLNGAVDVLSVDMDNDGDLDIVACGYSSNKIVWYENDSYESFTQHIVATGFYEAYGVSVGDYNGDGLMDVSGAAWTANDIGVWFQQIDGTFTNVTLGEILHAHTVESVDINDDNYIDIIAAGAGSNPVRIYYNDSTGNFTEVSIDSDSYTSQSCKPVDIDDDGDFDILSNSYTNSRYQIFRNDGSGTFTRETVGHSTGAHWATCADIDNDGDLDFLAASYSSSDLIWYAQDDTIWTPNVIDSSFNGAVYCEAGDFDNDGDLDIIATAETGDKIAWYENDGNASFTMNLIRNTYLGAASVWVVDFDQDGDLDVLSAAYDSDEITWWRNTSTSRVEEHGINHPVDFEIQNVFPNPFNSTTTIQFSVNTNQRIDLALYNINGRRVTDILDKDMISGVHSITLQASNLSSGTYIISCRQFFEGKGTKITLIK